MNKHLQVLPLPVMLSLARCCAWPLHIFPGQSWETPSLPVFSPEPRSVHSLTTLATPSHLSPFPSLHLPHTYSSSLLPPPPVPSPLLLAGWSPHVTPGAVEPDGLRAALRAEQHGFRLMWTCGWWTWRVWRWLPCWRPWSSSSRFWSVLVGWQTTTAVSGEAQGTFSPAERQLVAEVSAA